MGAANYLPETARRSLVKGYAEMITNLIAEGYEAYYLNFMFNQIPGNRIRKTEIMIQEVERVHRVLTWQIVRWPDRECWRHLRPIIIGCPDLPVWKHEKELLRNLVVNDGLHFNAVALVPPASRPDMERVFQRLLFGRQSRLTISLDKHLWHERRRYHNELLYRLHAVPVANGTTGKMTDYMLKTFKHGRVDADSITIWN